MRLFKTKTFKAGLSLFLLPVLAPFAFLSLGASPSQAERTNDHTPNLMYSCRAECPHAKTNEDVLQCFDQLEKAIGDSRSQEGHPGCYKAIDRYQKITKAEEEELERTG
jgi:hypothetical protein